MRILPHAELDDGKLDVMLVKDSPRHAYVSGVIKTFRAKHTDSPYLEFLRGEEIEVSSSRPFVIYADGDPIGATPAIMRVERRCLRFIAPA
jgi:diacylglycerol kinase (ATP)